MSIVTRHGDGGETSLLYGGRVHKDDLHTEAYGALDEAISAIGQSQCRQRGGGGGADGAGLSPGGGGVTCLVTALSLVRQVQSASAA